MTTADRNRAETARIETDGVYKLLGRLSPTALAEVVKDLEADAETDKIIDRARLLLTNIVGEAQAAEMLAR